MKMRTVLGLAVAAGVSMSAIGCDDPVPPSGEGALQLVVGLAAEADLDKEAGELPCSFNQYAMKIGEVTSSTRASIADGTNGVSVQCIVRVSGAGFDVTGNIIDSSSKLSFAIDGHVETGVPGTGDVTLNVGPQNALLAATKPCEISLEHSTEDAQLAVSQGRVWATVTCPRMVVNDLTPPRVCRAKGVFVFENCQD